MPWRVEIAWRSSARVLGRDENIPRMVETVEPTLASFIADLEGWSCRFPTPRVGRRRRNQAPRENECVMEACWTGCACRDASWMQVGSPSCIQLSARPHNGSLCTRPSLPRNPEHVRQLAPRHHTRRTRKLSAPNLPSTAAVTCRHHLAATILGRVRSKRQSIHNQFHLPGPPLVSGQMLTQIGFVQLFTQLTHYKSG
jgi:hypothetical protein